MALALPTLGVNLRNNCFLWDCPRWVGGTETGFYIQAPSSQHSQLSLHRAGYVSLSIPRRQSQEVDFAQRESENSYDTQC
jgi:hypothetical protein